MTDRGTADRAMHAGVLGGRPSTLRGMGFMVASSFLGTVMAAAVRHLALEIHPFEIAFFRAVFGCLFFVPFLIRHGIARLRTRRLPLHALRGGLQTVSTFLMFTALTLSPLAKVTALNFSAPLFATVLALMVLGEVIHIRRITALVLGLAGALVIVRPGFAAIDQGSILILFNAATLAVVTILIKMLMRTESSVTTTIYGFLFALPIAAVATIPVWQTPSWPQLAWLAAIGGLGGLNHLSFAQALKEADLTAVLPIGFTRLIWAAAIGYVIFAEVPDVWTWVGGTMIFSASTYIAFRERRIKTEREARTPPPEAGGAIAPK